MLIKVESRKSQVASHRKFITSAFFLFFFFFYTVSTRAQCAMCRAVIETSGNQAKAQGINDGIVYLMVIPYILVGLVFFTVYRMYANKSKA